MEEFISRDAILEKVHEGMTAEEIKELIQFFPACPKYKKGAFVGAHKALLLLGMERESNNRLIAKIGELEGRIDSLLGKLEEAAETQRTLAKQLNYWQTVANKVYAAYKEVK